MGDEKATFIATESGCTEVDGESLVFVKGKTIVEEGHPILENCPDYFVPTGAAAHYATTTTERTPRGRTRTTK